MIIQSVEFRWIIYFFIYSFLGWVFESCYVSLKEKKWTNRGFLKGPFLPIYGTGAVMMLVVSEPFKDNLVLTYFAGVMGATLLELLTGEAIEAIFKVRYWDYSNQKFNYKGYICLSSSVAWGLFTIGMNEWLHPAVLYLLEMAPAKAGDITFAVVAIVFDVDVIVSVKEAVDLRELLMRMENARYEMQLLKKRADVIMAVVGDEWHEFKDNSQAAVRLSEMRNSLELQLDYMKKSIGDWKELTDVQIKEIEELQNRFGEFKNNVQNNIKRSAMNMRHRILGNPTMASRNYSLSLDLLKHRMKEERKGQDETGCEGITNRKM